ncbi:MAG TPA: TonB family protein, partial [Thermoanaerobaculia bacterium]|nr:TonB family protein [Thermoanaerobaculia bacterium]
MSEAEAAVPSRRRRRPRSTTWPLLVAAAAVVATLVLVWSMLHPRRPPVAPAMEESAPAAVTVDKSGMRRDPSSDSPQIATLAAGARVTTGPDQGRWVRVQADGKTGFLPSDAIERDSDRDARERRAKTLLALPAVYGVVADDSDVRLAPFPLAARAGRLTRGTVIEIHAVDHGYFAFRDQAKGVGFVNSAAVDIVPPDPRQPEITPEKLRPLKNLTVVDLNGEPPPEEEPSSGEEAGIPAAPKPPAPPAPVAPEAAPGLVEPAVVATRIEPTYPEAARRLGMEGTVELEVSIDASGRVAEVEVTRGLPMGLSDAAVDAVRKWTWKPARTPQGPVAS